jgi:hypothetical protein
MLRAAIPSAQCFPHEVSHTYNTWTNDPDGGRTVASTITRCCYDCSVQPDAPKVVQEDDAETGLRRVTFLTPYVILYPANPKLNPHDIVSWIDELSDDVSPVIHTIQVLGSRNIAGVGSSWEVRGEELS